MKETIAKMLPPTSMSNIYLLLLPFLVTFHTLEGQSISLKAYGGISSGPKYDLHKGTDLKDIAVQYRNSSSAFFMPAVALETRKGNFLEIGISLQTSNTNHELSALRVPPSDSLRFVDLGATKWKSLQGQFEFNYRLRKNSTNPWRPSLGGSINPHYSTFIFQSYHSYIFPRENYVVGADLGFIPRIQYDWTSNFSLDLNACFFVASFDFEHSYVGNPSLTKRQSESGFYSFSLLEKYWLRVGLSWKIWGKTAKE